MGHPKALLHYRGTTFLQSILDAALAAGVERRVVVLGVDADKILAQHELRGVIVATNRQPEAGAIGSIRAGIETVINHPVEGILVWPVDYPHVLVGTVEALLARFAETRGPIVVPTYQGRRGHPVIFSRLVFGELLAAGHSEGAKVVVRRDPGRVVEVPVRDRAVLEGIDTPAQYEELVRRSELPETPEAGE